MRDGSGKEVRGRRVRSLVADRFVGSMNVVMIRHGHEESVVGAVETLVSLSVSEC